MTVQDVLTHGAAIAFGGGVTWLFAVAPRSLAIRTLGAEKLASDRENGKLLYRIGNQLDTIAELRGEVAQLTKDVKREIESGNKLFEENRRLKRADQPRNHGRFAPKLKVAA